MGELGNKIMKITDINYPHLVSFPRSGSHWIRAILELYLGMDSKQFSYSVARTMNHVHDLDLSYILQNVIYLFRNPIDSIYSLMVYYRYNLNDISYVDKLLKLYVKNLRKWLLDETFTHKKTIITYENLLSNMEDEFKKICNHLGYTFDKEKLDKINVSKQYVKNKTLYDNQIVNLTTGIEEKKEKFKIEFKEYIYHEIFKIEDRLRKYI